MHAVDVAIIGAGPYGLSIAAHLQARGIDFRIFGPPMEAWKSHMPAGMMLKSDGSSSDLSEPEGHLTLKEFCGQRRFEHHDTQKPVPLDTFIEYGLAFQRRFVPMVEPRLLVSLARSSNNFSLRFADGEVVAARRVIVAVGIIPFRWMPGFLGGLPPELLSHSSQFGTVDHFRGKAVAVLGAGASALDLAALLHEQGAETSVIARRAELDFHSFPASRAVWRRVLRPNTGIGLGWRLRIFSDAPQVFRALPQKVRRHQVSTLLGPSGGWFMKDRILGRVQLLTGRTTQKALIRNGRVHLSLSTSDGRQSEIAADHVIAATGYRIDLRQLKFLTTETLARIRSVENEPLLSANFESTVPGLFFVGPMSMSSFGPVTRFVYGAKYTAFRIVGHLARSASRRYQVHVSRPARALAPEIAVDHDLAPP